VPALGFGQTAPDAVWLLDLEGVLSTFLSYRANLAHGLGANLSTFSFVFAFLGTRWKKEV